MNDTILIIEDEAGIACMLELLLSREGYSSVLTASTGAAALSLLDSREPDIILLDVMLPDCNGFELCLELRKKTNAPVLFLTSRAADYDKLTGFAMGGDDYITKPFNSLEVVARIKAQLARKRLYQQEAPAACYAFADFEISKDTGGLTVRGQQVHCTAKEFVPLLFFASHPGRPLPPAPLYEQVRGPLQLGAETTGVFFISELRHH
ncbi:transcriptional regulator, partial [Paenibacillus riograndensis]